MDEVRAVLASERIEIPNDETGRLDPFLVFARCAHLFVRYHCVPCNVPLANDYNLGLHIQQGSHAIVMQCATHGYVAMDPATLESAYDDAAMADQ